MKKIFFLLSLFSLILSCTSAPKVTDENWKEVSNKFATDYSKDIAHIIPEIGSSLGFTEYDKMGTIVTPDFVERIQKLNKRWLEKTEAKLRAHRHPGLVLDLKIFKSKLQQWIKEGELDEKYQVVDVPLGSKQLFQNIFSLLSKQFPKSRNDASVDRIRSYVENDYLGSLKKNIQTQLKKYPKPLMPFNKKLEKYLENSSRYVPGLAKLLPKKLEDQWKPLLEKLNEQVRDYDQFVRAEILPIARKDAQEPLELYSHKLTSWGVDQSPEWLIEKATAEYNRIYKKAERAAEKIAKKRGYKKDTPAFVIGQLKKSQVTKPEAVKKLYENATKRLKQIILVNDLVTLPQQKQIIRLAGDAESRSAPVPHLKPPPILNNKGERPEFVVPTSSTGKMAFDDFSYEAMATILTAHEARPGHDLQFSRIVENQTSIIRARYAFNSVNVEGWGLYAEEIVMPFLSDEEQLAGYISQLFRVSRMFLDPKVQLGRIGEKEVVDHFTNQLGISEKFAKTEYNRYAFRMPGQATAYYFGMMKIKSAKSYVSSKIGKPVKEKCFNDTLVSFGLVPVDLIKDQIAVACRDTH